ncbi:hypothetical protein DFQ30_004394 [Apophysomyces sp. BC1015]|nr:hypothetical protein DFQ30_004394 [Apophysomyces sp. BC1015]
MKEVKSSSHKDFNISGETIQRNLLFNDNFEIEAQNVQCRGTAYKNIPNRCKSCISKKADVCRFAKLRAFRKDNKHYEPYFVSTEVPDQIRSRTRHDIRTPAKSLQRHLLKTIRSAFLQMIGKDIDLIKKHEAVLRRRPPMTNVRHRCDICLTSIFNMHWICGVCGLEICNDCYESDWDLKPNKVVNCTFKRKHTRKHMVPVIKYESRVMKELHAEAMELDDEKSEFPPMAEKSGTASENEIDHDEYDNVLIVPADKMNISLFQQHWMKGKPVMVQGVMQASKEDWSPKYFSRMYGKQAIEVTDCYTGSTSETTIKGFFKGFSGDKRKKFSQILKIKDWPPKSDFRADFPNLYNDFMQMLPAPEHCTATGYLNLSNRLPDEYIPPDLGPKMFIAYGSVDGTKTFGTTNLHCDMADAVNLMCYADTTSYKKENTSAAAIWDIYPFEVLQDLRKFVAKIASERKQKVLDPIHSQWLYLNDDLRERLWKEYRIKGWRLYQDPGCAIFIPAGCAHQVSNYRSSIKCAYDFVSPENLSRCAEITKEFGKVRRDDALQLNSTMLFSWTSTYDERKAEHQ